jgi:uncharacterized protein (DUF1330 family)
MSPSPTPRPTSYTAGAFQHYGATFLARGGEAEVKEGSALQRHVIIQFPSMEAALACYDSPAYQEARRFREASAIAQITIVAGV